MKDLSKERALRFAFNKGSLTYDEKALIQKFCAQKLAQWSQNHLKEENLNNIVDLGCGTGLLTEAILPIFPQASYFLVDLSEKMLTKARQKKVFQSDQFFFKHMNFEKKALFPADLMMSNFCFHWLNNFYTTLSRLIHWGQRFLFTFLVKGTCESWYQELDLRGLPYEKPFYPSSQNIKRFFEEQGLEIHWFQKNFSFSFFSTQAVVDHFRQVGACPKVSSSQRHLNILRSLLKEKRKSPYVVEYCVLFIFARKSSDSSFLSPSWLKHT